MTFLLIVPLATIKTKQKINKSWVGCMVCQLLQSASYLNYTLINFLFANKKPIKHKRKFNNKRNKKYGK